MKRILILTTCLAPFFASAQSMNIGYCGDVSDDAIGLYETETGAAAVHFDADFLQQYAGNEVTALVIQLGASFGSTGSVFITPELSDADYSSTARYATEIDIPNFDIVPCYDWIEVPLPQPFKLDPERPFYAGIRILPYASAPYYGAWQFAVDDNAAGAGHNFIYDAKKKAWAPLANYTFEDLTNPNLLIKLKVEGNALPMNDVSVSNLCAPQYMRSEETKSCTFNVTNLAANDVTDFQAELLLDGMPQGPVATHLDKPLQTKETTSCTLHGIHFDTEGTHTVGVRVTTVQGVADTHPDNNSSEIPISVIDHYYNRNVLVEAFTTMSCANCPNAHERMDKAYEGVANAVHVDHHSGFGTDILTTPFDTDFLWFYNNGGTTYAPGAMFDRAMVDDFFDVQRSPGEEHTPVFGPGDPENILFIHNTLAERPAFVDINISANYNPTSRHLDIHVEGETIARLAGHFGTKGTDAPTINVWLTESQLSAADNPRYGQMTGSGRPDMTFVHNHALRTSLTGSWGKDFPEALAPYALDFSATLDPDWKAENMDIVVFISNFDPNNPDNCRVHNAATLPLSEVLHADPDGIVSLPVLPAPFAPLYDLQGRRVSSSAKGITIGNGRLQLNQ